MRIIFAAVAIVAMASAATADPLSCNLTNYKALPGLTASVASDALTMTWDFKDGSDGIQWICPSLEMVRHMWTTIIHPQA